MNYSFKHLILAATVTISFASISQKTNETSAAVERNNSKKAMMTGNTEGALKSLLSAKEYIDKAAVHEDTKNNQKTLWLIGDIYGTLYTLAKATDDNDLMTEVGEDGLNVAVQSLTRAYPLGKKYKGDVVSTVDQFRNGFFMAAGALYDQEKYEDAGFFYEWQGRFATAIEMLDTTAWFNSGLCYEKAEKYEQAAMNYEKLSNVDYVMSGTHAAVFTSRAYRNSENLERAKAVIVKAREKRPSDKELLTELVNINIESGDAAGAEKALNDAISADPNNVQLHYTIGTIYIDLASALKKQADTTGNLSKLEKSTLLKQASDRNGQAEKALRKALELAPENADIQYQLGAHLYNWATELKLERDKLSKGDPRDAELLEQSETKMKGAIEVLEKYIEKDPENKAILDILYRAYYKSGNSEKALEYKRKLDALK